VDGIYSMEGDIADVPGLLKICRNTAPPSRSTTRISRRARPHGEGTAALTPVDEFDLIVGTFSKSWHPSAVPAGSENVIHYLAITRVP